MHLITGHNAAALHSCTARPDAGVPASIYGPILGAVRSACRATPARFTAGRQAPRFTFAGFAL